MPRNSANVISCRILEFTRTGNPIHLCAAIWLIFAQRRLLEVLYGCYCRAFVPPHSLARQDRVDIAQLLGEAEAVVTALRQEQKRIVSQLLARLPADGEMREFRIQGVADVAGTLAVGEYHDCSARVCLISARSIATFDPYSSEARVRHIHLVRHHRNQVFIATGDSKKYLDQFVIEHGQLRFVSRSHRYFGGFTAGCSIGQHLYLGTDFSYRPNYIECFETGRKFGFPKPAYAQLCAFMVAVRERYIVCMSVALHHVDDGKSVSIFDTLTEEFIFCRGGRSTELPSYVDL